MSAKVGPKDLPCLFESLANKYGESSAAAKSIMELAKYFMNCLYCLTSENYSYVKCTTTKTLAKEMHYN